ncbi:MAG: hypothetical protein ACKOQ4_04060 [Mycobacterium sp.]
MNRSVSAIAGFATITVATLAGCSADKATPAAVGAPFPASPATSSSPMVGGMTECTKAALAGPALAAAQALGPDNLYTVDQLNCADGWAVTGGVLAGKGNPDMGAPTSFVFEQEGQFWVPKDKAQVCGTNPTTTTAPADAQIPAALYLPGCAAG